MAELGADLTPPVEQPTVVRSSALPENTVTLIRYILVALGSLLVAKGYLSDEALNDIVGGLLMILPTIWGVIATQRNHAVKVTLASKLPDHEAQVK